MKALWRGAKEKCCLAFDVSNHMRAAAVRFHVTNSCIQTATWRVCIIFVLLR